MRINPLWERFRKVKGPQFRARFLVAKSPGDQAPEHTRGRPALAGMPTIRGASKQREW